MVREDEGVSAAQIGWGCSEMGNDLLDGLVLLHDEVVIPQAVLSVAGKVSVPAGDGLEESVERLVGLDLLGKRGS